MKVLRANRGSIMLEAVIALAIGVIILIGFTQIFSTGLRVHSYVDEEDNIFFSSDYLLAYIEREIYKAEEIYILDNANYGILFYRELDKESTFKHNYVTYIFNKDRVIRIAENKRDKIKLSNLSRLKLEGYNNLCEGITFFDYSYEGDYILLKLDIGKGNQKRELEKKVYFTCEIYDLRGDK